MKVTMLKDAPGSPNGFQVVRYNQGKDYDLPDHLANAFVKDLKVAVPFGTAIPEEKQTVPAASAGKKMDAGAPENKMSLPSDEAGTVETSDAGAEEVGGEEVPAPTKRGRGRG